jgi:Uma2 family endonuclease
MSEPAPVRMTADEFIAWAMNQPEGQRYEPADGEVIATAPERSAHTRATGHIFCRLADAVEREASSCEAFIDGLTVVVIKMPLMSPTCWFDAAQDWRIR